MTRPNDAKCTDGDAREAKRMASIEARALRERWPISEQVREAVIKANATALAQAARPDQDGKMSDPRGVRMHSRVLIEADRVNAIHKRIDYGIDGGSDGPPVRVRMPPIYEAPTTHEDVLSQSEGVERPETPIDTIEPGDRVPDEDLPEELRGDVDAD